MSKLLAFAKESYENSRDHGFWENKESRNKAEMVKLMICESSEAVEGHRKYYNPSKLTVLEFGEWRRTFGMTTPAEEQWQEWFRTCVKDKVPDELADVVIRILDYTQGWEIPVIERIVRKETTGNFAHDMLRLDHHILQAYHAERPGYDWGYVLAYIELLCEWYNIDIENHIKWKQTYNRGRPMKHGKNY